MVSIPFELPGFEIKQVFTSDNQCIFTAKAVAPTASCPNCKLVSNSIHSYYTRTLQDLPLTAKAVRLILRVRRFRCLNSNCPKQTFAEPLPQVVAKNAQRTQRLTETLQLFAANLSAKLGSRMLKKLKIAVSPTTLVRLLKQKPASIASKVKVLGVDDFAFRRGRNYGTILVNLETHTPIDLLPDRNAATLGAWLRQHPEIEIVSRDRSPEYARAIREGAPQALQVADRWHIVKNWREVLERIFQRFYAELSQRLKASGLLVKNPAKRKVSATQRVATKASQQRRVARYDEIKNLSGQGYNILQIATKLEMSRGSVRKFLALKKPPTPSEVRGVRHVVDPYIPYLQKRWDAGYHNAKELWRELVGLGFKGSYKPVQTWVSNQRKRPGRLLSKREKDRLEARGDLTVIDGSQVSEANNTEVMLANDGQKLEALPVPRNLVWLFLKKPDKLNKMEQGWLAFMLEEPALRLLGELSQEFLAMLRKREATGLDDWLEKCEHSGLTDLQTFAEGIGREYLAIKAGLSLVWSNGPVEGEVNRLKFIKRSMYGRAGFELLRQRVLKAS